MGSNDRIIDDEMAGRTKMETYWNQSGHHVGMPPMPNRTCSCGESGKPWEILIQDCYMCVKTVCEHCCAEKIDDVGGTVMYCEECAP